MRLYDKTKVALDLCRHGFVPDYEVWVHHGESFTESIDEEGEDYSIGHDRMDEMLEAMQSEFNLDTEDPPTPKVEAFFKLLKASKEPLREHTEVTILAFLTRLIAIKSKYFFSNNCYNELIKLISDILPNPHKVPKDMYQSKKMLSGLGMNYEKIEGCIAEAFSLKEVAYFSSVYFAEEHNVNAPLMRYNVDEEPPCSDLSIFQWRGTTVGSSAPYYYSMEERKAALLYMYANIDGIDKYFE